MRTSASLLLSSLLACSQAFAHGLWTEQRRGNHEVIYGHGAEDDAFNAQKISGAWAYDASGKLIPVSVQRLDDHARLQPLRTPAVLAVALDNGTWSQTPDKQWINRGRSQVPNAIESLHTYKYSLAILAPSAQLPELSKLRLAIVPQSDPLAIDPGKPLRVQVLVDGKPTKDVKLIGDYRSMPQQISATTDADGYAEVVVRNEGLNIIAAEHYQPAQGDRDIEKLGLFSSLTFLGREHHE